MQFRGILYITKEKLFRYAESIGIASIFGKKHCGDVNRYTDFGSCGWRHGHQPDKFEKRSVL